MKRYIFYLQALIFTCLSIPAIANISGPIALPAGATRTVTDTIMTDGTLTLNYTGINLSAYDQLWWGPESDMGFYYDVDRAYTPGAGRSEDLNLTYQNNGVWTGNSWAKPYNGALFVDIQTRATVSGLALVPSGTIGLTQANAPEAVSEINADSLSVSVLFEARYYNTATGYYTAWAPIQTTLNNLTSSYGANGVSMTPDIQFSDGFFYTAVPAPGAIILGGIGTALIGWRRRHH